MSIKLTYIYNHIHIASIIANAKPHSYVQGHAVPYYAMPEVHVHIRLALTKKKIVRKL